MTFRERVYEITKKIPQGKVATYGQVANMAGNSKAARAVGVYMRTNPHAPSTPCHRVVAFDGQLTGYSGGGVATKKNMLLAEGVFFKGDIVDLSSSLWQG